MLSSSVLAEDSWEWSLSGSLEQTLWAADGPAPGLLKFDEGAFYQPRLSLELGVRASEYFYFHTTARFDRGFDAADEPDGQARLDEVFLRYQPLADQRVNFQIGKFATVFGGYVREHNFYDNPFLSAPLPYDQIIGVAVLNPAGNSPAVIRARALGLRAGVYETPKRSWASTAWGPGYTTGAAVFGSIEQWDYAFEVKNVEPGAHANQWDVEDGDFDSPTFAGRIGYRPNAEWAFGVSFSRGPYLNPETERLLPSGIDRGDLANTKIGFDARWSYGDFIVSGEVIYSIYDVLGGDDLESLSWFVQGRWKVSPGFWMAARFGQIFNNEVRGSDGQQYEWSPDLWRAELGAGYRITPDVLLKAQYSFTQASGDLPGPGEQVFGLGLGVRF